MTERKVLRWSSPANAWALGAQALSLLIAVNSILGIYDPVALREIAVGLAEVWQWTLFLASVAATGASLLMQFALGDGNRMQAVIRVEAWGTVLVAAGHLLLWGSLVGLYGFATHPLTQLMVGVLGVAALGRVAQIIWESQQYRRALAKGDTAHVEAIAQPKDA